MHSLCLKKRAHLCAEYNTFSGDYRECWDGYAIETGFLLGKAVKYTANKSVGGQSPNRTDHMDKLAEHPPIRKARWQVIRQIAY
jgi:hypothetical protein